MTIRFSDVPFCIVLLAALLPWPAAYLDSKPLIYLPDSLATIAYIVYLARRPGAALSVGPLLGAAVGLISVFVLAAVLTGRGVGSGGLLALFYAALIFGKLLDQGADFALARRTWRQISALFVIHISFLFAELVVRLAGYTHVLVDIAGYTTEVTRYKTYNSAAFLNYLGFEEMSGLNSLLLGSQTASQLMLFAMFWFAPIYRGGMSLRVWLSTYFWFVLAVIMFPLCVSMTAMGLLIILTVFVVYVLPNSKLNRPAAWLGLLVVAAAFGNMLLPIFTYRIETEDDLQHYIDTQLDSPYRFAELPIMDQVLGVGSQIERALVEHSEFGLGMLLIQTGVLVMAVAAGSLLGLIVIVLRAVRRPNVNRGVGEAWASLAGASLVGVLGWAVSLGHYTPAIELGGRQFFALLVAVCLVSVKNIRALRKVWERGLDRDQPQDRAISTKGMLGVDVASIPRAR